MKGVLGIALLTFKWCTGIILGFIGTGFAMFLILIVLGLLFNVLKRRQVQAMERVAKRSMKSAWQESGIDVPR